MIFMIMPMIMMMIMMIMPMITMMIMMIMKRRSMGSMSFPKIRGMARKRRTSDPRVITEQSQSGPSAVQSGPEWTQSGHRVVRPKVISVIKIIRVIRAIRVIRVIIVITGISPRYPQDVIINDIKTKKLLEKLWRYARTK